MAKNGVERKLREGIGQKIGSGDFHFAPYSDRAAESTGSSDYSYWGSTVKMFLKNRLAFTLPAQYLPALQAQWPEAVVIGRAVAGQGVQLLDGAGRRLDPPSAGYQHFGSRGD